MDKDDTEASLTRHSNPNNKNNDNITPPPVQINPYPPPKNTEGRVAEKAKDVQISTLEFLVVAQRQSVFDRISEKDACLRLRQSTI